MKKNYFKGLSILFLSLFVSVTTYAQLGTNVYTLGADNANNYAGTWNETTAGTGFSNWVFDTYSGDGGGGFAGRFLGSFSTALDVSSNSFGLFANSQNNATSGATRSLPQTLQEGDVFTISIGVNFRDGAKGFDLRDASNATILNFNVGSDKYTMDGSTDLFGDAYDANTVITFTFTQNATSLDWTAVRSGGLTGTQSGTKNTVNAGTITNLRLYNVSAGTNGDGSGARNLFFNSFEFTSLYSINANSSVTVSSNTTAPYLTIESGSSVTVNSNIDLDITGNLSNSGTLTANDGSSLRVGGTATGEVTYNLDVNDTNWHLLSSPVENEGYDTSWVDANLIDNTTRTVGTNVGISTYDNTTGPTGSWTYATDGSTGTFNTAQGYSIKRDATGSDIMFTGTLKTDGASPAISANDVGGANENRWTLIGNPFPSYIDINALLTLTANATALEDSREALYVWNGSAYTPLTTGYIHPGQGFFVNSDVASTNIAINQDMLSHQTGVTFYKNANTSINLIISDGSKIKSTEINYLDGKTTGLDPRFDLGSFNGVSSSFNIFSQLVSDNNGVEFARQALPNTDLESMVIPVGITADAGEITFSAEAMNLPSGLKVFLEDRTTNTFTRLDEANTSYKIMLTENTDAIGRFYLHTKSGALSTTDVTLENISIYPTNKSTLRIVGLSQGKSTVKLFNTLGKQVLNTSFTSTGVYDLNLPKLATGLYIVQLENETGTLNKKIVLE